MKKQFGVYIVESLEFEDEDNGNLDGAALAKMLGLCGIPVKYTFIRTGLELEHVMRRFDKSRFKYLHLSSHGSKKEVELALDNIPFERFAAIIGPHLSRKRLFLSACNIARFEFAKYLTPQYDCLSILGSPDRINFDKAGIFWSTFYYLMYQQSKIGMKRDNILPTLAELTELFDLELRYFSMLDEERPNSMDHLRERHVRSGKEIYNRPKRTPYDNEAR